MTAILNQKNKTSIKGTHMLTLLDSSTEDIYHILELALDLKEKKKCGIDTPYLKGKTLAMIFEKPSTRTRVSFEAGMLQLGGNALYLNSNDLQIGRGETIADTAKVLSQYVDGIMIRTFEQSKIEELAKHASIPVINGLTDEFHPCQALADLLTIFEIKKTFAGSKLAYIGDGNNVAHSLLVASAKVGLDCTIICPEGYKPDQEIVEKAISIAKKTNAKLDICHDPIEGVKNANFIYTDVWSSMGQEEEKLERNQVFYPYQVNSNLVKNMKPNYYFLHCLPAHRGEEVTEEIIDGPHSIVFEQAANRLHVQKALLTSLL